MTNTQLLIVCITVLLLAGIVGNTVARIFGETAEDELPPPRIGHRVTVHTKQPDDQTLFGVLVGDYADRIVLEDAEYVTPSGGKPISGKQHIATADVAWLDLHALVAELPETVPTET